ncbi:sugar transferase [Planococcus maritimus]|uniref:sugar transferase n=1 Tax=Planococcus maritimus TaxID=192421 RepID=UPI000AD3837A
MIRSKQNRIYKKFIKRLIDLVFSLMAIIVLSPVYIVVALLVRVNLGSPVIFKHKRPGLNEEVFPMYKFRSMTNEKDENGNLLPNNLRHTKFGKILRSSSLDELPGFLNVLKGEMSLVGPRPLLIDYLDLYNEEQKKRHNVRPGLTGYAQVNGRNTIGWEEKFNHDLFYVENVSLLLDIKIIFMTVVKIIKRSDINSNEKTTMKRFEGSK